MRLIDADALLRDKEDHDRISTHLIYNAPTINAVPVTRCRDCRHYTGKWCTIYSTKRFDINDIYKDDDDFCSQAERKEE